MKPWKIFAGLIFAGYVIAQQAPQSLLITKIAGINSAWAGECGPNTVSNTSQFTRQNTYHSFAAQGTGSWSVTLQYSNTSCTGPWTSYGGTAFINQGSTVPIAYALDPPFAPAKYVQIIIVGNAVGTYTAENSLYIDPGGGAAGLPSGTPNQVLATDASGSTTDVAALRPLVLADLPAITTSNVPEGSNLYFTAPRAVAAMAGLYQTPITTGTTAQYFRGDFSLATFPTNLSQFTNGPGFISANQNITFSASGDASGTTSGATNLSPSLTVNGLKGSALPSLTTGNLRYNGTSFIFDATAYQAAITTGTTAQYFRGDLSLATFPTNLSSFTNGPGYLTVNQSITFTAGGDLSGAASGATSISPSLTVTGLKGAALPALSAGFLKYSGVAWAFDSNTYLTANQSITWTAGGDASGSASGATSIGPSLTIIGLKGSVLPALATGNLRYNGTSWVFDSATYSPLLTFSAPLVNTSNTISLNVWGSGTRPVAASALGVSGNCAAWGAVGLIDVGSPCGTGGSGANALGTYLTASSTNAPANAVNLGLLTTGLLKITVAAGSATPSTAVSGTDYAPPTSGGSILYGNSAGGFLNVTVGSGLSFSGGTLSNTASGGNVSNSGTPTVHQVGVWVTSTTIAGVGPGAANMPLLGSGSSADPAFSTISYPTSVTSGGLLYASSTTALTNSADFTISSHTLAGGASAILDLSLASTTAGLKIPAAAGAVPTADDFLAFNTTNHAFVHGSNGTTLAVAAAASGTNSATTCSNQVLTAISAVTVPTCTALTSSFLPLSAMGTISGGTWNGSVIGPVYGGTGVANGSNNTVTFTGNFTLGITLSANTNITFPTSGTLSTTTGTVTSVSFTGGIISVANPTTTPAFTVAGTSGGIPYFSSATGWASTGALTANAPVIGGGAGAAPTVGSRSGNTTTFGTTSGTLTSGDCAQFDSSGNVVDSGAACGSGGGGGVNSGTATHLAYYATTGATVSDMGANFTFNSGIGTLSGNSSAILDMSAANPANGLVVPKSSGAAPTTDATLGFNSTSHALVWGNSSTLSTMYGAVAGVNASSTTCANQVIYSIYSYGGPGCITITSAYVNTTIMTGGAFTGGLISVSTGSGHVNMTVGGTSGGIPYFSGTTTWASSGAMASGQFILGGGAGNPPTTSFSIVPIANGGTNSASAAGALINLFPTATRAGDVMYCATFSAGACTSWALLAGNNSGTQYLQENSSGVAAWGMPTAGAAGTSGQIQVNSAGSLAGFTAGGDVTFSSPNFTVVSTHLSAALPLAQGGTNSTSTTAGLVRSNGTAFSEAELSGDAQTSGSNAVTNLKVNGVSYPTTASSFDALPILTASNTVGYYQINGGSNCGDGTHALSYNQASHTFGCQVLSSGGGGIGSVGDAYTTATAGQATFTTAFTLTGPWVFVNGNKVRQGGSYDFTFTSGSVIFNTGLRSGDVVEIIQ